MLIRPATSDDASLLAEAIAMAENADMLDYLAGTKEHAAVIRALRRIVLSPRLNRYSLAYSLVADVDGTAAGAITSFPADNQHELDWPLLDALQKGGLELTRLTQEGIPGTLYLSIMAVSPEYRRRGVASALLQAAVRAGREHGLRAASLLVDSDKPLVKELYRRLGFTDVDVVSLGGCDYERMRD